MPSLDADVRFIKGIGENRAKSLAKLKIGSLRELLTWFPRDYEDRRSVVRIGDARPEQTCCVRAMVASRPTLSRVRRGMELVKFRAVDETGAVDITYFNQNYVREQLTQGKTYIFYGKLGGAGGRLTMANPVFESEDARAVTGRIVPIYRLTSGLSQKVFMNAVRSGLDACEERFPDYLPESVRVGHSLCVSRYAYENIHFPSGTDALIKARERLIFEELFVLACAMRLMRGRRAESAGIAFERVDFDEFRASLPFSPTGAQNRAMLEIMDDMCSGRPMNRLIQGDVGSGKTLVAAAGIFAAFRNSAQCAFMAPTEILAQQHFNTLTALLSPFGLRIAKLTGSTTAKRRSETEQALKNGELDLVVGTHALISQGIEFRSLALVVTDEQHRFGVGQREALRGKGGRPHALVMSATPIPRTLALMIYGELDISIIDELPPGRQRVDTFAVGEEMRPRVNAFVKKLADGGRQIFVVCPMIDENDVFAETVKSAEKHAGELQDMFPGLRIACIHGRMKARDKEKMMSGFVNGDYDVLVSTTVIEVGVDVPNAALMIVENAERFGLSQLHQLRGRVGRGDGKSYCVLFSDTQNETSKARLDILCGTNDGFRISEEDLRLRGPGDFFGSRQHGLPELRIADFCTDMDTLSRAQRAAERVLAGDPRLEMAENAALAQGIDRLFSRRGDIVE